MSSVPKMRLARHVADSSSNVWVGVRVDLTGCVYVTVPLVLIYSVHIYLLCNQDKEEVQKYKAEIKAHLLREGLIRGQPRAGFVASNPRPSASRRAAATPYARPYPPAASHGTVPADWNFAYGLNPGTSAR
jgi:hypothetical protein